MQNFSLIPSKLSALEENKFLGKLATAISQVRKNEKSQIHKTIAKKDTKDHLDVVKKKKNSIDQ